MISKQEKNIKERTHKKTKKHKDLKKWFLIFRTVINIFLFYSLSLSLKLHHALFFLYPTLSSHQIHKSCSVFPHFQPKVHKMFPNNCSYCLLHNQTTQFCHFCKFCIFINLCSVVGISESCIRTLCRELDHCIMCPIKDNLNHAICTLNENSELIF